MAGESITLRLPTLWLLILLVFLPRRTVEGEAKACVIFLGYRAALSLTLAKRTKPSSGAWGLLGWARLKGY